MGQVVQLQIGQHVAKALDAKKQELTCVVLRPEEVGGPDLHGDVYTAAEVEKACRNFNLFCMKGNIQHEEMSDALVFVESYIAPADFILGAGIVKKGDWVATVKVTDKTLWTAVEKGDYTGLSIGCNAMVEDLKDAA